MKIDVEFNIDYKNIYSILVSALEGGSNYWYYIQEFIKPKNFDNFSDNSENGQPFKQTYPLNEGGALMIDDSRADEPSLAKPVHLNLKRIEQGLKIMAEKYPRHFTDFLNETDDGGTADVFLQCCIFGDVIYG